MNKKLRVPNPLAVLLVTLSIVKAGATWKELLVILLIILAIAKIGKMGR